MRIAHITATFPPYYSGTGMVCYYNALELARRGHDVTVFTAAYPPGNYEYPPEIKVVRLRPLFRLGNAPVLPALLQLKGFDVVHLHLPFIVGAELVFAASWLADMPYVVTYHNDLIGDAERRYLFDLYSATAAKIVLRGARSLIVVSLDHALASPRIAPALRQCRAQVVEVPNGVDTDLFRPSTNGIFVRRGLGITDDSPAILFVGTLDRAHHYRRVDVMLRAAALTQHRQLHVLIAGGGDQLLEHQSLAHDLGMGHRVHFLGEVAHQELPKVYMAADVVVLPSHMQEAFPLVLLEAMACGRPFIASDLPGVRSMAVDEQNGVLVRSGDVGDLAKKITWLLNDPHSRRMMGTKGRAHVEANYTWPRIAARLEKIYQNALTAD